jgi:hypothetical protein
MLKSSDFVRDGFRIAGRVLMPWQAPVSTRGGGLVVSEPAVFEARCPWGKGTMHYWLEPVENMEGVTVRVVVRYKCKFGHLDSRSLASKPSEVRDTDGRRITKRVP